MLQLVHAIRVWPVDVDYLPWIVWAMSLLLFLLAGLCAMELIRRLR